MNFHPKAHSIIDESNLPSDPKGKDLHTYHVHKNGDVFREISRENDRLIASHRNPIVPSPKVGSCDQDRLTLIHLSDDEIIKLDIPTAEQVQSKKPPRVPWPNHIDPRKDPIPQMLADKLKNICTQCDCKQDILWRNFRRADSHFEACFRYYDDGKKDGSEEPAPLNKCFLKLYTLRVPYIAKSPLILSMVHHIRVEGKKFVSAKGGDSDNKEHMFGLIAGFEAFDVTQILTRLIPRWSDIPKDHLQPTTGLTPKLFLATVISQYGFLKSRDIVSSCATLDNCDENLQTALQNLQTLAPDSFKEIQQDTEKIQKLNQQLVDMNRTLTGTKSIMHYLASSAGILIDRLSAFEIYVDARLGEWQDNRDRRILKKLLWRLDSSQEKLRDRDKLQVVQKAMQQHMVDIDALHEHIDINVSMVRNLIAEKDRAVQFRMANRSNRDGFNMKIIAILTAFFLPGTFMAVLLTTPMFKWDAQPGEPVILKLPFEIYWATSLSMTLIFAIGLVFISKLSLVKRIIDILPGKLGELSKKSEIYRMASESFDRQTARNEKKEKEEKKQKEAKNDAIARKQSQHDEKDKAKLVPMPTPMRNGNGMSLTLAPLKGVVSISEIQEGHISTLTV